MHAAHALKALSATGVNFVSFGMGADKLAAAGMELILDCRELAVIGIVDVLINYPRFVRRLNKLRAALSARRPDLLVIVDYPDFNLKLAATAKKLGIPVLFYISPQVWAWRPKRVLRIAELVSHMAVLFPFEVQFYTQAGVPVTYVGHPLVDDAHCELTRQQARLQFSLVLNSQVITLLPGSRLGEIQRNLPIMLLTAKCIRQQHPDCQFLLPCAPTLDAVELQALINASELDIHVLVGDAYTAMRAADCVLCASGTATLETAMLGTPMAIVYVINAVNYALMKHLIQIDDIGLVNIVAGKRIVREFVQHAAIPEDISIEMNRLLVDSTYTDLMCKELAAVQQKMGAGGASNRVAELITQMLIECRE